MQNKPAQSACLQLQEVLLLKDLRVTAAGKELLAVPELRLNRGEIFAIVGNSGSGKSLLAKALIGILPQSLKTTAAVHEIFGVAAQPATLEYLRTQAVGYINQDAQASMDNLQNIQNAILEQRLLQLRITKKAAGANRTGATRNRTKELKKIALKALKEAGFRGQNAAELAQILRRKPDELSGGMRQRALIAAALAADPQLIIADEPTSALDAHIGAAVMQQLVAAKGERTLVLVSHDLAAVREYADRVAVVAEGKIVEMGAAAEVLAHPVHKVTKELIAASNPVTGKKDCAAVQACAAPNKYFWSFESAGYTARSAAVRNVQLELAPRECVALIGESGSGKTTTAKTLLGLVPHITGLKNNFQNRYAPRIAWVPQDTRSSLLPRYTCWEVLQEALKIGRKQRKELGGCRRDEAVRLLTEVGLAPAALAQRVSQLSGGSVQRLAIARALATNPEILILDEPVSALDASVRQTVTELLQRLQQERGFAMLLISHELQSVQQLAHRVLVFAGGEIVEQGSAAEIFSFSQHFATKKLLRLVQSDEPAITGEHSEEK